MDTLGIIRQMEQDEGLRAQLRAVLLGDELLGLPKQVAEMDLRLTTRLDALAERVGDLEERVAEMDLRLTTRLDALTARMDELTVRMDALAERVGDLEERVAEMDLRLTTRLDALTTRLDALAERVGDLEERVAEMDLRLTTRLDALARAQQETNRALGALSTVIGGGVEEDAVAGVQMVARERGWRLLGTPQAVDLGDDEVDVVGTAEDSDGSSVTFVVEAKVRLRPADVERFFASLPARVDRLGLSGTILPYCYGMRLYAGANEAAEDLGVGLLTWSAEPVAPRPFAA